MAGHSHWAGIKHKKAREDAKRGKVFSKCVRAITVAARQGGGDPAMNLALRYAIEEARDANMPKDSIERAVKKGTGELAGAKTIDEVVYEGYAPGGVAVLVEAMTDNRNRTSSDIGKIFERHSGHLGQPGCVVWMFAKKGLVITGPGHDEEQLMEIALAAGAEDINETDGAYEIVCEPDVFADLKEALQQGGVAVESAQLSHVPQTYVSPGEEDARKVLHLLETLEDHDDVQKVHANFDIDAELVEKIQAE